MEQIFTHRFDLYAKHIYVYYKNLNITSNWYVDLYKDHIIVFNGGWEYPGTKNTPELFVNAYDNLINSVQTIGYKKEGNEIEINDNNVLINNAHRFVTAYYYRITPIFRNTGKNYINGYSYDFFSNRMKYGTENIPVIIKNRIKPFITPEWMDRITLEASYIHKNMKVITLFPVSDDKLDCDTEILLSKNGTIIYKKIINLTRNGLYNYVKELYLGEKWLGYTRKDKTRDTWGENKTRVYFFVPNEGIDMVTLKRTLRIHYNNKNSVHINDNHREAVRYSQSVLQSVHYLNHGKELTENNQKMFENYKSMLMRKNKKFCCIDSSFVMAFYGLREAKDLDFLHSFYDKQHFANYKDVHSHNSELKYYSSTLDDIVFNPKNHFFVNGYKVASLHVILKMKRNRNEDKDKKDMNLIKTISGI